jgi:phage terminase small subunit
MAPGKTRKAGRRAAASRPEPETLDLRERLFTLAYVGPCKGNGTQAALEAGYGPSPAAAAVQATRLLSRAKVRQELERLLGKAERATIADATERDELLTRIMRAGAVSVKERIRAIQELNRCSGRHSVKHLHEGKLTLEQALAESRE